MTVDTFSDERTFNLFVPAWLDEMGLTPNAFRVYAHLVRRASGKGAAWPSLQSIGDTCFDKAYSNARVRRRHAIAAIAELQAAGLLVKRPRFRSNGNQDTNEYVLIDPPQSRGAPDSTPRGALNSTPGGTEQCPKGNQIEGNHILPAKGSRKKGSKQREHDEWVDAIVPVLYQTTTFAALNKTHWSHVHGVRKKLIEIHATPADLAAWYKDVWRKGWPGTTRPPRPSEVGVGVAAYLERKAQSPAAKPQLVAVEAERS